MLSYNKETLPMIAIILINYNGFKDTIECLNSIRNLTYRNYSVYLVDNCSTNNSCQYIKEYCVLHDKNNVIIINNKNNLGFSGGNNVGIKAALNDDAEYILLLNNDTIVTPKFLDILVTNADKNSIITPRIMYWKEKDKIWYAGGKLSPKLGRAWHDRINKIYEKDIDEKYKEVSFISGCCMLIHRDVLAKIGLLEEKFFLYYEDTEYCWRALNNGVRLSYVGNAVIFHNVSSSIRHDSSLMNYYKIRNRMYLIKEYVSSKYKIISYLCAYIEVAVGIAIKKYQFQVAKEGIGDFKKGIFGKKRD